jgi:histidine triad (HIT) family protein
VAVGEGRQEVSCIFCQILEKKLPAHVVLDDDVVLAFLDRTPLFHGHVLVIPRTHVVTLPELKPEIVGAFFQRVQLIAAAMPGALKAEGTFVAMNNVVSQSVPHLHCHVVPRTKGDGLKGFFWPRKKYAGDEEMASVAEKLRASVS